MSRVLQIKTQFIRHDGKLYRWTETIEEVPTTSNQPLVPNHHFPSTRLNSPPTTTNQRFSNEQKPTNQRPVYRQNRPQLRSVFVDLTIDSDDENQTPPPPVWTRDAAFTRPSTPPSSTSNHCRLSPFSSGSPPPPYSPYNNLGAAEDV